MTFIDNMSTLFLNSGLCVCVSVCVVRLFGVWVISPLLLAFALKSKYIISFTKRLFKLQFISWSGNSITVIKLGL